MGEIDTMTGVRKAAVLLIGMGKEASAKILSQMREAEVEEITSEIMRLRNVAPEIASSVFNEFHELASARSFMGQGGFTFAQELLSSTMGPEKANDLMHRLSAVVAEMPFQFLHRVDARQLLGFLQEEHPQTIALVLAHLSADQASTVLSGIAGTLQAEVAHRIAVMDRTSPEIIKQVETILERKLSSVLGPSEMSSVGGLQPLVEIINRADRSTERLIMEGLDTKDSELAEEIRSRMFVFEDITTLDDKSVQLVLRSVESAELATALKGTKEDVRAKVMKNLSERAAENLAEEIDMMGPVRLRAVEEAQAKVVQGIRALEETGQITIRRGADDEFVS